MNDRLTIKDLLDPEKVAAVDNEIDQKFNYLLQPKKKAVTETMNWPALLEGCCPMCGSELIEKPAIFYCERAGNHFVITKARFGELCSKLSFEESDTM